jgi:hypothetical protein
MSDAPVMTLRERVAGERRRLKSVRETLTAAVARKSGGDSAFAPFYVAVADYIETSMGRLHAQDVKKNLVAGTNPANLASFELAGAAYTNYIVTNMGHHGGTTDLAGRLFTPADWDYMAGVTDEETRTEQQQYARVFSTLPPALNDLRPAS